MLKRISIERCWDTMLNPRRRSLNFCILFIRVFSKCFSICLVCASVWGIAQSHPPTACRVRRIKWRKFQLPTRSISERTNFLTRGNRSLELEDFQQNYDARRRFTCHFQISTDDVPAVNWMTSGGLLITRTPNNYISFGIKSFKVNSVKLLKTLVLCESCRNIMK